MGTRKIPRTYDEARALADDARDRAFAQVDLQRELEQRHRDVEANRPRAAQRDVTMPFDVAVDTRLKTDQRFKSAINDNRWYIDYATMYAQGEQIDLLREIRDLLRSQVALTGGSSDNVIRRRPSPRHRVEPRD